MIYPSRLVGLASLVVGLGALVRGCSVSNEIVSRPMPEKSEAVVSYENARDDKVRIEDFRRAVSTINPPTSRDYDDVKKLTYSNLNEIIVKDEVVMSRYEPNFQQYMTALQKRNEGSEEVALQLFAGALCLVSAGIHFYFGKKKSHYWSGGEKFLT